MKSMINSIGTLPMRRISILLHSPEEFAAHYCVENQLPNYYSALISKIIRRQILKYLSYSTLSMYYILSKNSIYNPDQCSHNIDSDILKKIDAKEDWSISKPLFSPSLENNIGPLMPFKHSTIQDTQHKPKILKNRPSRKEKPKQALAKSPLKRVKPDKVKAKEEVKPPPTLIQIDMRSLLDGK
jgi:hypothetical protein